MTKANHKMHSKAGRVLALPSIDDDDDILMEDLNLSNSIMEESFLSSTASLSPDENEEDLPVGIVKTEKRKKWKDGDVAWIKHRHFCFWPSYIKTVSANKISAYFICYNKFSENERAFRYALMSKNIKKFRDSEYKNLIAEGRKYMSIHEDKRKVEEFTLTQFNKAVELAEAYLLYKSNGEFSNQTEELEFFRTKGVSLCLKTCHGEGNSSPSSRPLTPSEDFKFCSEEDKTPDNSSPVESAVAQNAEQENESSTTSTPSSSRTSSSLDEETTKRKSRKRKKNSAFDSFNRKCNKLVAFITSGSCDQHLLDIYDLKIESLRMMEYFNVWDENSPTPIAKNMKTEEPYFCNEDQLQVVSRYLRQFITTHLKNVVGIVRIDELLFSVFLPEATIFAIKNVFRKKIPIAVEIYNKGFSGKSEDVDPFLTLPLSEEERAAVERRNNEFLKKIRLECT